MELTTATLMHQAGDALIGLYRHAPGFEARLTRQTWLVASGESHPLLNWITVIEPGRAAEAALRDHVAAMRSRGLPALIVLTPAAGAEFDSLCPALGLVTPELVPLMICNLADLASQRPVTNVRTGPIRDAAALREGMAVIADAFRMPRDVAWRSSGEGVLREPALAFAAASRDGQILSVVATSRFGPLVYVDMMATAARHRRQGIGYALLWKILADERATGATHAFLVASDEGRALYERLGFRVHFETTVWELTPTIAG